MNRLSRGSSLVLALLAGSVQAQSATDARAQLNTQALAATCANCHGTQGRALPGAPVAGLAGRPAGELAMLLRDFRSGRRASTVMQQLAKGFNDTQIDLLAAYFAAQLDVGPRSWGTTINPREGAALLGAARRGGR